MKRIRRDKGVLYYTLAKDTILSKNLSLKAKALLAILLNLPDNWNFKVAGITSCLQEGREAVMSALKELESAGYLSVTQVRDAKGRMKGREYIVRELKADEPESGKPQAELAQQSKTKEDKPETEKQEKKYSNSYSGIIARNDALKAAMKKEGDEKGKGDEEKGGVTE
ncbi:MAG: hypothetical protein IJ151_07790 [Bacteroidales bacterium]|nr:hypothetical protein [Bacteroidales bacterium]